MPPSLRDPRSQLPPSPEGSPLTALPSPEGPPSDPPNPEGPPLTAPPGSRDLSRSPRSLEGSLLRAPPALRDPAPRSCPSGTPQPSPPAPRRRCRGLPLDCTIPASPGPTGCRGGVPVGGRVTALPPSSPLSPCVVRSAPTSRRPHFALPAEPRVVGGGAIAAASSSRSVRPPLLPPPHGPDTVGLFREAGRSSPLKPLGLARLRPFPTEPAEVTEVPAELNEERRR